MQPLFERIKIYHMTLRRVSVPRAQKQSFNETHSSTEMKKEKGKAGSQFSRYMISPPFNRTNHEGS